MTKLQKKITQPFHMVDQSPWPILTAMSVFNMVMGFVIWFTFLNKMIFLLAISSLMLTMALWFFSVSREASFQGHHTFSTTKNLRTGMALFILSEVMFFFSFFWSYFHSALTGCTESDSMWPPTGVHIFNPLEIPLLNTLILLTSGFTATWAHHSLIQGNMKETMNSMSLTVMLGIYFTSLQFMEYSEAKFNITDSAYGSIFFLTTGFHGAHVMIGTTFLLASTMRIYLALKSSKHHFGLEAAIWYWHFVDVVWLFVYLSMYYWPTM